MAYTINMHILCTKFNSTSLVVKVKKYFIVQLFLLYSHPFYVVIKSKQRYIGRYTGTYNKSIGIEK